jgi:hypothetical protein
MQRKTTLATAAAVTLVLLAGSAAAATNLGLLDYASDSGTVGSLTPQDATANASPPDTVIVEPATQPRTPTVGHRESDDDAYESDDDAYESDDDAYESDDDAYESDDDRSSDDEHEDEDHEQYEGQDDDD